MQQRARAHPLYSVSYPRDFEVVGTSLRLEQRDDLANGIPQALDRSLGFGVQ